MKKLLAVLLILALLPCACTAEGFLNWFGISSGAPTLRYKSLNKAAFSEDNARVIAGDKDERYFLITGTFELYIWDSKTRKRVDVHFDREEDQEALDFCVVNSVISTLYRSLKADQRAEKAEELREKIADYLSRSGHKHFSGFSQIAECFPRLVTVLARCEGIGERYSLVSMDYLGFAMTVELSSGKSEMVSSDSTRPSLSGDLLLTDWRIIDLVSGETSLPDVQPVQTDDGVSLSFFGKPAPILLSDGSLAALTYASKPEGGMEADYYLSVASPQGSRAFFLGTFRMANLDTVTPSESARYLLVSRGGTAYTDAVILDRETGGMTVIDTKTLVPFAACGENFLCYDTEKYCLVQYDPESKAERRMDVSGLSMRSTPITVFAALKQSAGGAYYCQGYAMDGYFVLS